MREGVDGFVISTNLLHFDHQIVTRKATQVVLSRFEELQQSLQELSQSSDTLTATGARCLFRQLGDFSVILAWHVIGKFFKLEVLVPESSWARQRLSLLRHSTAATNHSVCC